MLPKRPHGGMASLAVALLLLWSGTASAQTYSSGSTGADGPFAPTTNTTLTHPPNGVFNFTTVTIPAGVTVTFTPNAANTPVTMLATGDVTIAGTLNLNGQLGITGSGTGPTVNAGGAGGPGGFRGGQGGARGSTNNDPSAGVGPGGGIPQGLGACGIGGTYGAPPSFNSLLPLFGGSGGGGQFGFEDASGSSGGGGGGALVLASSTNITVTGAITANGAAGGSQSNLTIRTAGGGSGGAIRLVAPEIAGAGTLQAFGLGNCNGGLGLIRLEAFRLTFEAVSNPIFATASVPGPVTAASVPALVNLPTLAITTVGGVANAPVPGGTYSTADVTLPPGTTNPVPVTITATNTPPGTVFTVRLIPQFAGPTTVSTLPSTGTFASSTATAELTFPPSQISLLTVWGTFTLPQIASLFPLIEGEPVERILVVATDGNPSTVTLITRSGKQVPATDLLRPRSLLGEHVQP